MTDTGGNMYAVSNGHARRAGLLFESLEGCDLDPAAAVCLAGLQQALEAGRIQKNELILLNITGGGEKKLHGGKRPVEPDVSFTADEISEEAVARKLAMRR